MTKHKRINFYVIKEALALYQAKFKQVLVFDY